MKSILVFMFFVVPLTAFGEVRGLSDVMKDMLPLFKAIPTQLNQEPLKMDTADKILKLRTLTFEAVLLAPTKVKEEKDLSIQRAEFTNYQRIMARMAMHLAALEAAVLASNASDANASWNEIGNDKVEGHNYFR